MEEDDRQFHDQEINDDRIMTDPTPLADWLNMQLEEYKQLFKVLGMQFDERDNAQLAKFMTLFAKNMDDKANPVGSVVHSCLKPEDFSAEKSSSQTWVLCHGQEVDPESKWFKMGNTHAPDLKERYIRTSASSTGDNVLTTLDDTVKNVFSAESEHDISVTSSVKNTKSKGTFKTPDAGIKSGSGKSDIRMYHRESGATSTGQPYQWSSHVEGKLADKVGEWQGSGADYLFSASQYRTLKGDGSQGMFEDHGHTHQLHINADIDVNLEDSTVNTEISGGITTSINGGDTETRPKSTYLNTYIRIN